MPAWHPGVQDGAGARPGTEGSAPRGDAIARVRAAILPSGAARLKGAGACVRRGAERYGSGGARGDMPAGRTDEQAAGSPSTGGRWRSGLAFATIWSSAFTSSRIVVEYWPPFLVLTVRFLFSGALALGIGLALGQRIRLTRGEWGAVVAEQIRN